MTDRRNRGVYSGAMRREAFDPRRVTDRGLAAFWWAAMRGGWLICQPLAGWNEALLDAMVIDIGPFGHQFGNPDDREIIEEP